MKKKKLNNKKTTIVNQQALIHSWVFKKDHVPTFVWYKNVFSKEECEKIITIGNSLNLQQARIGNMHLNLNHEVRKSNVSWISPNDQTEWIFLKMQKIIESANEDFFKFNISGINEGLQFTQYKAPGGHYHAHIDKTYKNIIRKLSITIQLSDPKNYEGGDLQIYEGDNPENMQKELGMAVIFPSYVLHRVTPVSRGERYSLVGWFTGDPFK
jgi:PKHD-type hydroxylase